MANTSRGYGGVRYWKTLLLCTLACVVGVPSRIDAQRSSRWIAIATGDAGDTVFVDTVSIVRADGLVRGWSRIKQRDPVAVPDVANAYYLDARYAYRVNCRLRQYAIDDENYSAIDGKSWSLTTAQAAERKSQPLRPVRPDSYAEFVMAYLCKPVH